MLFSCLVKRKNSAGQRLPETGLLPLINWQISYMNEDLLLFKRLEYLRVQHRNLDSKLNQGELDEFSRKRLQKEKLSLRDEIMRLENMLYPNVPA